MNSIFSSDEIKEIRAIIADLKAAPKLIDSPLKYVLNVEEEILEIYYGSFKIISKIVSKYKKPTDNQIDRIKIIKILNIGLQSDLINIYNFK